ncbi:hypothetical protein N7461_000416 [Penicillium sp. DV-2018c]|nr:hypothetical protein N7461_000416 [Penicillium sp. DV-2018c]
MTSVQSYYEEDQVFDWISSIVGDNGSLDPRTLKVHQVATDGHIEPNASSESAETPSPDSSARSSLDSLRIELPLKLELEPPFPKPTSESTLFGLHNQIRQATRRNPSCADLWEEDTDSLAAWSTDSEYERCLLPFAGRVPSPSEESTASSSASSSVLSSASAEPQWLPLVIGRVIKTKTREACRMLKK